MLQPCSCNIIQSRALRQDGQDRETGRYFWCVHVERHKQKRSEVSSSERNQLPETKETRQAARSFRASSSKNRQEEMCHIQRYVILD